MADFTGFYLDGIHSSTYGILRVSDGDRYKEGLIPEFEDREIELSGGSGSIYVNTQYKKTPFEINIAFEHLTEQQFRDMRKWLGGEKLHSFRFDERPYKTYWVKLESRPELEYICFMEESDSVFKQEERIYKGEGTLSFVAYDPFGYCMDNSTQITIEDGFIMNENGINWQVLDTYSPFTIIDDNIDEWGSVSGLKTAAQLEDYNKFEESNPDVSKEFIAKLYNPGDFETDFQLFLSLSGEGKISDDLEITLELYDEKKEKLLNGFKFTTKGLNKTDDLFLDSKKHSLSVLSQGTKSLRYDLIKSSHWFKIPIGESYLKIECANGLLEKKNGKVKIGIKYNYKYY